MAVTTETNRTAELTTNGVVEDFDFAMLIHAASEVQVWYKPTGGTYSQLTLNTDYGIVFTEDGGTVSTNGYTAPLAAGKLLIIRWIPLTQQTNWLYLDNHSEPQHQDDFDRASIRPIQIWEYLRRALKFAIHSTTKDIAFPEPESDKYLRWNETGTELTNVENITLEELDAVVTALASGDILRFNGTNFVNESGIREYHISLISLGEVVSF